MYFVVVSFENWSLMVAVAAVDAAATSAVIAVSMALEKAVTSISILLGFRVSDSSSSLSGALFFDPCVAIVVVLRGSGKLVFTGVYGHLRVFTGVYGVRRTLINKVRVLWVKVFLDNAD